MCFGMIGQDFEFGAETVADTIQDVMISNCYVPRFTMVAMDIQNGDRGHIENVVSTIFLLRNRYGNERCWVIHLWIQKAGEGQFL